MSDATKKSQKSDQSRQALEESDLYENNRSGPQTTTTTTTSQQQPTSKHQQQRRSSRQTSPVPSQPVKQAANVNPSVGINQKPVKDVTTSSSTAAQKATNGCLPTNKKQAFRVFIALFDYDPFKMSPNTDSCQEELPFKEGQLIKA